jgi:catechol-2,3-dioxygenase
MELALSEDADDRFAVETGSSRLIFECAARAEPAYYHYAINVPVAQFETTAAWLQARTPLLSNATGETVMRAGNWPARMVYFADPDGNIGELIARDDLETDDSRILLHLSEIGLADADPLALVAHVQQTIGLAAYRNLPAPDFSAIGDPHGLLIVVPTGRRWYPEGRVSATDAALTATVTHAGKSWQISGPPWNIVAQ